MKLSVLQNIFLFPAVFLLLMNCQNKEVNIEINENQKPEAAVIEKDIPVIEEVKPLMVMNSSDTVKIMVRQDGAPGMYLGDDGKVHGFYVDLEKMVMEEMGQSYEFIAYDDVGPIVQGLKSGIMHIALAVPDLPDYRSFLNLSDPYEILQYVIFVQTGNTEMTGTNSDELIQSLSGKKVGVQTQGHIYQVLRDFKEIELIEYPTTTQALADLDKGVLDAVPDVKRIGQYYAALNGWDIVPIGEPILSHKITTAFSQALDPSLLKRYNAALQTLIDEGKVTALYSDYFGTMTPDLIP